VTVRFYGSKVFSRPWDVLSPEISPTKIGPSFCSFSVFCWEISLDSSPGHELGDDVSPHLLPRCGAFFLIFSFAAHPRTPLSDTLSEKQLSRPRLFRNFDTIFLFGDMPGFHVDASSSRPYWRFLFEQRVPIFLTEDFLTPGPPLVFPFSAEFPIRASPSCHLSTRYGLLFPLPPRFIPPHITGIRVMVASPFPFRSRKAAFFPNCLAFAEKAAVTFSTSVTSVPFLSSDVELPSPVRWWYRIDPTSGFQALPWNFLFRS